MFQAEMIQYLLPDGRQKVVYGALPDDVFIQYSDMIAHGCRLEGEVLRTGLASITVSDGDEDIDVSITPNDDKLTDGLVAMLERGAWRRKRAIL